MKETKKTKGLGRGLSALLADIQPENMDDNQQPSRGASSLPIELVQPNPDQPRREFSQSALEELAASIEVRGVVQPIIVRKDPRDQNAYQIVAGERRWRAAQLAGLHEIPALIRDYSDELALEIAVLENVQRADLTAIEEARAYKVLMERFGHTQEALASQLGKSRSHLANMVRLLSLPEDVQQLVEKGDLSSGHARALVTSDSASVLAAQIVARGLSVRETEQLVKKPSEEDPKNSPMSTKQRQKNRKTEKDTDTIALEQDLSAATGMKVGIEINRESGKGEIRIGFSHFDQLDWLCSRLG